jgi:tetratricopeptide (TPR) repeat protein
MKSTRWLGLAALFVTLTSVDVVRAQYRAPGALQEPTTDPVQLVEQSRTLTATGRLDEAFAKLERALALDPKSADAHLQMGVALDIDGRYSEARQHFDRALTLTDEQAREPIVGAIAVSYVFDGDVLNAARYYQKLFDRQMANSRFDEAAATANALGRVFLETGDIVKADLWYQTGRETAGKLSNLPGDQIDLWAMRWHHAQSRIAARRGDHETASREADALQDLLDKNALNQKQASIYQYLQGYDAFYAGAYDDAIASLLQADQRDPFILGLLAQAYEKTGDISTARAYYTKVLASNRHDIQNALARAVAKQRLAAIS